MQLHKSPGEDVIQLFDLSVIPKKHCTDDSDDTQCVLPSLIHRGRSDSLLSLGTLLYRIAHRLSLSMVLYGYYVNFIFLSYYTLWLKIYHFAADS